MLKEAAPRQDPNVFLIGVPRCGTTNVAFSLARHPNVYFTDPKEPFYFAADFPRLRAQTGIDSLDRYRALFKSAGVEHKVRAEGSTVYLASDGAIERVLEHFPEAKFVVCVRSHIEVVQSLHRHLVTAGLEARSLHDAWYSTSKGVAGEASACGSLADARLLDYRFMVSFGSQIARLLDLIPRARAHFMNFEDLVESRRRALCELQEFLGLPESNLGDSVWTNRTLEPRSVMAARLLRTQQARRLTRSLKGLMPETAVAKARATRDQVLTRPTKNAGLTSMDAELRAAIADFFAEDAELLRTMGIDVSNA